MQKTLLTFVDDIYEDLELWYPKLRCEEAGFAMRLARHEIKTYKGKHGYPAKSDCLLKDARSEDFCGLLVPGGFMPDKLRRDAEGAFARRASFSSKANSWRSSVTVAGFRSRPRFSRANASLVRLASRTIWKMPAAFG